MSDLPSCEFECTGVEQVSGKPSVRYRSDRLVAAVPHAQRAVDGLRERGIRARIRPRGADADIGLSILDLENTAAQSLDEVVDALQQRQLDVSLDHVMFAGPSGHEHVARRHVYLSHIHVWPGRLVKPGEPLDPVPSGPGDDVTVAIVDTGFRRTHEYFGDRGHPASTDEVPESLQDGVLSPIFGHGTFIASIVRRLAPRASILGLRMPFDGVCVSDSEIAAVVAEAAAEEPDVIVLAWGLSTSDGRPPRALRAVLARLADERPGTVVVAAAGNDGETVPTWPAAMREVIAVGAVDDNGQPANRMSGPYPADHWATNRGEWVDMGAIGVDVRGAFPPPSAAGLRHCDGRSISGLESGYGVWEGTSMAAAVIAGAVAAKIQQGETGFDGLRRLRAGPGTWVDGIGFVPKIDASGVGPFQEASNGD